MRLRSLARALLSLAMVLLLGCSDELGPPGQVLLYLDTDAPVPPGPGAVPDPSRVPALFDTALVEVFEPGHEHPCAGCSRIFALHEPLLRERRASLGLPQKPGLTGYRVRVRLFSSASTPTGAVAEYAIDGSPPQSVIEVTAELPAVTEEGIVERSLLLPVDAVGLPIGSLESPVQTAVGTVRESLVGTWPGAERVPCAGQPSAGQVCVPGGAYWMGNPFAHGAGAGDATTNRRLVVLSPFFMDNTEVTVGRFRTTAASTPGFGFNSGNVSGNSATDYCTYTTDAGPHDDKPMACVSLAAAQAHCEARGGQLPSGAQFEYAASGLEGRLFIWGSDLPSCQDAVLWRVGYGALATPNPCPAPAPPGGPETVGALIDPPRRDRLELPGGILYDLVGNIAEYTRNNWNRQEEPCWSAGGVFHDPVCTEPSPADGDNLTYRGGAWIGQSSFALAAGAHLAPISMSSFPIFTGFRCVTPAAP